MPFLNGVSRGGGIALSRETASTLVGNSIINGLLETSLGDRYNESKKETLIKMLSTDAKSPLFYVRSAVIFGIIAADAYIPHFIQSAFILPLSTTYSFGHGLLYGLLSGPHTSYGDFMSRALVLTLILFHLGVILVFLTLRKLCVRPLSAALGSLLLLFSITMYSYGYHLGSTIWNFSAGAFFLWFVVAYYSQCSSDIYLKRIAWLTGILVFFSYVIVFYWVAFLLAYFVVHGKDFQEKPFFKKIFSFLKSQISAIVLIFLCALLFYPFGQTPTEGIKSPGDVLVFPYYILLNLFSFYNKSSVIDFFQCGIAATLMAIGIYSLFSGGQKEKERILIGSMLKFFFLILFAPVVLGVLSFGPSRHILFIAPFVFVLAGAGIDFIFYRFTLSQKIGIALLVTMVIIGFASVRMRINDSFDRTSLIKIDPSVQHVVVNGCSFHLLYKKWGENRTPAITKPNYLKGDTYYYAGEDRLPDIFSEGLIIDIIDTENIQTGIQFTAYNPEKYPWDRQNGFFAATFRVIDTSQ
jgi:hypothetical protein